MFRDIIRLIRSARIAGKATRRKRNGVSPADCLFRSNWALESLEARILLSGSPPVISTSRSIQAPAATDSPVIISQVTDTNSLTSVDLVYTANNGSSGTTSTPFTETFGSTATGAGANWTGTADNTWTLVGTPDPFKLLPAIVCG